MLDIGGKEGLPRLLLAEGVGDETGAAEGNGGMAGAAGKDGVLKMLDAGGKEGLPRLAEAGGKDGAVLLAEAGGKEGVLLLAEAGGKEGAVLPAPGKEGVAGAAGKDGLLELFGANIEDFCPIIEPVKGILGIEEPVFRHL